MASRKIEVDKPTGTETDRPLLLKRRDDNLTAKEQAPKSVLSQEVIDSIMRDMEIYREGNKPGPLQVLLNHIRPITPNPKEKMSFVKKLFFCWVNPIFNRGYKGPLQNKDIYKVPEPNKSTSLKVAYDKAKQESNIPDESPLKVAFRIIKRRYIISTIAFVLASVMQYAAPFLVQEYLKLFSTLYSDHPDYSIPITFLVILGIDLFARSIILNQSMFHLMFSSTKYAIALRRLIYEKMLKMNIVHLNYFVETTLVNLLTIDMDNLTGGLMIIPNLCAAFTVLAAQFYFLYALGWLTLILIAMLVLVVLCFKGIHARTKISKTRLFRSNDQVSKILKEFVKNINNVKICHFSEVFYRRLIRKKEFESKLFKSYLRWTQAASILNFIFPTLFGLAFFGLSVWFFKDDDSVIDLNQTYLVLTILSIMRTPLTLINEGFDKYPEYMVSKKRIEAFLTRVTERPDTALGDATFAKGTVRFRDASVGYSSYHSMSPKGKTKRPSAQHQGLALQEDSDKKEGHSPIFLRRITFSLHPGSKLAVVGPNGSGKSFLLLSILGETDVKAGTLKVQGATCFIGGDVSLVEDSIAQNILMGQPFVTERYNTVLKLCHLEGLLSGIAGGDQLILKDNGSNVTRKLRRRLCLARFLYTDADIYLIDGFLDFLEEDFRTRVLKSIITEFLREKTVLIITSQADVCQNADRIIVLDDGAIVEQGTFEALSKSQGGLFQIMVFGNPYNSKLKEAVNEKLDKRVSEQPYLVVPINQYDSRILRRIELGTAITATAVNTYPSITSKRNWKVIFNKFFLNYGWALFAVYIGLMVLSQLFVYTFTWFTAAWKAKVFKGLTATNHILIYILITLAAVVCLFITAKIFIKYFRKISFRLFYFMIRSLITKDLDWFQRTPASEIINVFVTDYNEVDQLMGPSISAFLQNFVRMNVGVVVMLYKTYIGAIFILIVYAAILRAMYVFLNTDRSLKQIFTFNRAHMVTTIMDCHKGIIEYRNSGHLDYLKNNFYAIHDIFQNSKSTDSNFAHRWLSVRIYSLVLLFPLLVMLDGLFDALVGLEPDHMWEGIKFSISFDVCFSAMGLINSFVRNESFFSDIERIFEYIDDSVVTRKLVEKVYEKDIQLESARRVPSPTTEDKGKHHLEGIFHIHGKRRSRAESAEALKFFNLNCEVIFTDVSYVYPLFDSRALRSVNFHINPRQKVAIVGQTASGKHTVMHLVAGLANPKGITKGNITVCGKEIKPGCPVPNIDEVMLLGGDFTLFEGNLRENIDPYHRFTDLMIMKVFEYLGFWDMMVNYSYDHVDMARTLLRGLRLDDEEDEREEIKSGSGRLSFHRHDSIFENHRMSSFVEHTEYLEDNQFVHKLVGGLANLVTAQQKERRDSPTSDAHLSDREVWHPLSRLDGYNHNFYNYKNSRHEHANTGEVRARKLLKGKVIDKDATLKLYARRSNSAKNLQTSKIITASVKKPQEKIIKMTKVTDMIVGTKPEVQTQDQTIPKPSKHSLFKTNVLNNKPELAEKDCEYKELTTHEIVKLIGKATKIEVQTHDSELQDDREISLQDAENEQNVKVDESKMRINSQPAIQLRLISQAINDFDEIPLDENVKVRPVPLRQNSPFGLTRAQEKKDKPETYSNLEEIKLLSVKKILGHSGGLESPYKASPIKAGIAELKRPHRTVDEPHKTTFTANTNQINENVRKYYQSNLPLIYRGLANDTITEDQNSQLAKPIPAFDYETAAAISPDRVKRLHKLLHSEVEYQGLNFSQTQKKLIQIGKAILANPNVLLLESNFFKVEEALEQLLFELIFKNLQSSTIIAILERYEMINYFDQVLVFEKGAVTEQGSPEELLRLQRGRFRKLVENQNSQDQKLTEIKTINIEEIKDD